MAYGEIKVDTITFTDGGIDKSVSISGLVQNPTFSGSITVTGNISGDTLQGQTISGVTVTGATAQFTSGTFISLTGTTTTGTTASFATGVFTSITGTTATITSGIFASGTAAAPSVSVGTTDNGLYSPGADQVAISTNGTGRLFVDANGNVGVGAAPTNYAGYVNFVNNGSSGATYEQRVAGVLTGSLTTDSQVTLKSVTSIPLAFGTNNTERLRITSDGKVGLGTSIPGNILEVSSNGTSYIRSTSTTNSITGVFGAATSSFDVGTTSSHAMNFYTAGVNRATLDTSGRLGIGTTSPNYALDVAGTGSISAAFTSTDSENYIALKDSGTTLGHVRVGSISNELTFRAGNAERARIDSDGRLLVGTSTARSNVDYQFGSDTPKQQLEVANAGLGALIVQNYDSATLVAPAYFTLARAGSTAVGSTTIVADGNYLGEIDFSGSDGTDFTVAASIRGEVDGTPGANDMPGRLVFSTTADGASSPTERMRITNTGQVWIANTTGSLSSTGIILGYVGDTYCSISTGNTLHVYSSSAGAYRFYVNENGGISNYSGNNVNLSDEREKKSIETLDSTWDCLKDWELKKFHYNEDADTDDKRYGVIAQQVAPHCPEVISQWIKQPAQDAVLDDDGNVVTPATEEVTRMGVKEQQMMWMAIKALQEAQLRIETLEAEVAALKGA